MGTCSGMTAWQTVKHTIVGLRERREKWRAAQEPGADGEELAGRETETEPIAEAEDTAARLSTEDQPLGRPGRPMDRKSPFFVGLFGALGVGVAYGLFQLLVSARDVLTLIGLAAFLAIGLNAAVEWLVQRRLP